MKYTKIAALSLAVTMLLSGCGSFKADETVMTIGDEKVSAGMYSFYLSSYIQAMPEETAKEQALSQCEANYKVLAAAKAAGIVFDEETLKQIDEYKQQVIDSYSGDYEDFLKENDITDVDIDTIINMTFYDDKLGEQFGEKEYTDEEKKEYYLNNYRRAKHILIATQDMTTGEELSESDQKAAEEKANELLEQAKNGADFDALISENSEDPGSATNPDGYIFTDNEMVTEFQDGVDSLEIGGFTLVKSSYGYHVIERLALDENPEYFDKGFESKKEAVEAAMKKDRFNEQVEEILNQNGIKVEINNELVDKIAKRASKKAK